MNMAGKSQSLNPRECCQSVMIQHQARGAKVLIQFGQPRMNFFRLPEAERHHPALSPPKFMGDSSVLAALLIAL